MLPNQTYTEKELLTDVAKGNEKAFADLVRIYSSKLYTYIYRITGNQHESEELVQDIFMQLWQTREALTAVENLGGYLYVLSKNRAANALKKVIRARNALDQLQQNAWLLTDDGGLEQRRGNLLDQAIDRLPPQQQKIWRMSRSLHMKYAEIATELGISKDTVNKSLQAAARNITTFIQQHPEALLFLLFPIIF